MVRQSWHADCKQVATGPAGTSSIDSRRCSAHHLAENAVATATHDVLPATSRRWSRTPAVVIRPDTPRRSLHACRNLKASVGRLVNGPDRGANGQVDRSEEVTANTGHPWRDAGDGQQLGLVGVVQVVPDQEAGPDTSAITTVTVSKASRARRIPRQPSSRPVTLAQITPTRGLRMSTDTP